jgi:predicted DNA-binding transcriptional regulator AlpA
VQQTAPDPLLSPPQVAERLNVSTKTLEDWRYRGQGPSYIKFTRRCVRYYASEIERFIAEHEQGAARHAPG